MTGRSPGWFKRFLLPGLGVKAVVIGGGYATGRELAEFNRQGLTLSRPSQSDVVKIETGFTYLEKGYELIVAGLIVA